MPVAKIVAMVVTLVFCITFMGLVGGLIAAFKNNDKAKEKSIGISACVFFTLTIISYKVMGMIPMGAP
jgi:hypothetical protein